MRAVLGWLRQQARAGGVRDGRGGAVVIVQRFGSALNLNVHFHAMVMDGVFTRDARSEVRFHAARYPIAPDVRLLLVTLATRIGRLLARHGVSDGADGLDVSDPWAEEMPTLAGLAAASVRAIASFGPRAGLPVRRCGDPVLASDATVSRDWHARVRGFDLHAGAVSRELPVDVELVVVSGLIGKRGDRLNVFRRVSSITIRSSTGHGRCPQRRSDRTD